MKIIKIMLPTILIVLGLLAGHRVGLAQATIEVIPTPSCEWTAWEDTSDCTATKCGTKRGVKTQAKECISTRTVCDYECPTKTYTFAKWSWDVPYGEKSNDPNHCHRPTAKSIGIPPALRADYNRTMPELADFTETNCQEVSEVVDTKSRRVPCRLSEVLECEVEPSPTPEVEPTPTLMPTPTVARRHTPAPTTPAKAPTCPYEQLTKAPANAHVYRRGGEVQVKWHPTEGKHAHIYYRENHVNHWQHAVRDIPNNGFYLIGELGDRDWTFAVQQANYCAAGPMSPDIIDDATEGWVLFR